MYQEGHTGRRKRSNGHEVFLHYLLVVFNDPPFPRPTVLNPAQFDAKVDQPLLIFLGILGDDDNIIDRKKQDTTTTTTSSSCIYELHFGPASTFVRG